MEHAYQCHRKHSIALWRPHHFFCFGVLVLGRYLEAASHFSEHERPNILFQLLNSYTICTSYFTDFCEKAPLLLPQTRISVGYREREAHLQKWYCMPCLGVQLEKKLKLYRASSLPLTFPPSFGLFSFVRIASRMTQYPWYHFVPAIGLAVGTFCLNMSTIIY